MLDVILVVAMILINGLNDFKEELIIKNKKYLIL